MRLLALIATILLVGATPAAGQEWRMAGKDAAHTNFSAEGPDPPLRRAWVAKSDDPTSSFTTWPVIDGNKVFAISAGGVISVDTTIGEKIYWQDLGGTSQVAPVVRGPTLYLPASDSEMAAYDASSLQEIWTYEGGHESGNDPSATLFESTLFFGLPRERRFVAVDSSNGSLLWAKVTKTEPDGVAAVANGTVITSLNDLDSADSTLIGYSANSGEEKWNTPISDSNSSPSIFDDKVIIGAGDFFAYALEIETGREIWRSPVEDKFSRRNMPAIAFGDVFLADRIGNIYRLDGETGERKWIFSDTRGTMDQSFPVIAGNTLYIGSGSGELYGIDVDDGTLLWKDQVEGIVLSGAADAERFYFGVKLGPDEGLYAYEHDPDGELFSDSQGFAGPLTPLLLGLLIFVVLFGVLVIIAKRSSKKEERATQQ